MAYDDDSGSENEENDEADGNVQINTTAHVANGQRKTEPSNSTQPTSGELFTSLPQPRTDAPQVIEEEQDEFLQKKETIVEKPQKRIKIDVPALNQFESDDDDDEPAVKKPKQVKASGLFALLPPPKTTPLSNTSFVPNVLQKKTNKPAPSKSVKPPTKNKAEPVETVAATAEGHDSDSNDDDIEIPETFDDETWQQVCGKKKRIAVPAAPEPITYQEIVYNVEAAPEVEKPYDGLDNQAFKELVGSKKRLKGNINLIDIHEDEIRPDREEWLKSLTDPNFEPQTDIKDPVNNTCKVKNHITSLAQKALANDKELQMRWAESRFNRKQTQAKYGF